MELISNELLLSGCPGPPGLFSSIVMLVLLAASMLNVTGSGGLLKRMSSFFDNSLPKEAISALLVNTVVRFCHASRCVCRNGSRRWGNRNQLTSDTSQTYMNQECNVFNITQICHDFRWSESPKWGPFSRTIPYKTPQGWMKNFNLLVIYFHRELEVNIHLGIRRPSKVNYTRLRHWRIRESRLFISDAGKDGCMKKSHVLLQIRNNDVSAVPKSILLSRYVAILHSNLPWRSS